MIQPSVTPSTSLPQHQSSVITKVTREEIQECFAIMFEGKDYRIIIEDKMVVLPIFIDPLIDLVGEGELTQEAMAILREKALALIEPVLGMTLDDVRSWMIAFLEGLEAAGFKTYTN